MPVSTSSHITHCVQRIQGIQPESVLDVGCGFGLWGFLCREYLDVWNMRVRPEDWRIRIDGIELFEPYIQAHQRALYSKVIIGDIREAVKQIGQYDLIIAGDVIEHLEKSEGEAVLECLYEKATKALLVNIPLGEGWDHPEEHGNPGELHRSKWSIDDFAQYPCEATQFELPCGRYGVFVCPKPAPVTARVLSLVSAGELRARRGDASTALRFLWQAYDLDPANEGVLLPLVEVLRSNGQPDKAVELLQNVVEADAGATGTRLLLARALLAVQKYDEAEKQLARLLKTQALPQDIAESAKALLRLSSMRRLRPS